MSHVEEIGAFIRSVPVPQHANSPDIAVVQLDMHTSGFVVRCKIRGGSELRPSLVALELRDALNTRYEHAGFGQDFIEYKPAIPANAEWVVVLTNPETRIDLVDSN